MRKLIVLVLSTVTALLIFTACGHTHAYGEWETETEATCEAEGVSVRKCSCGEKETKPIAKAEHTEGELTTVTEATCKADGLKESKCTVCGETVSTEAIAAGEDHHDYVFVKTFAPKCTTGGYDSYKCSVCDKTKSDNRTEKLGHDIAEFAGHNYDTTLESDGTKYGYCSRCKKDASVPMEGSAAILREAFRGKNISIIGDSISTYAGVSNDAEANSTIGENRIYYDGSKYTTLKVDRAATWWQQAIDGLGANLLVNNSVSGSNVLRDNSYAGGAYKDRAVQLHDDVGDNAGTKPDIIFVYLGTNDYSSYFDGDITLGNAATLNYEAVEAKTTAQNFAEAYAIMLHKMTEAYPDAEIYCLNVLEKKDNCDKAKLTDLNNVIATVAEHYGAHLVDIRANSGIKDNSDYRKYVPSNDGDGGINNVHPNDLGMDLITECVLEAVFENSKYYPEFELN